MDSSIKKILVATDLSARSDRAILRAIRLTEEFKAKLIIINVIDNEISSKLIEDHKKLARQEIEQCLNDKVKNIEYEIKICIGNSYDEILKVSEQEKVDLIVLGIHRHTDRKQPVIGNVIKKVVDFSHKSILIVRDRSENNYDKILSSLDFNIQSKKSLKTAFELFNKSKFYLLHSYQIPFEGFLKTGGTTEKQIIDESYDYMEDIKNELKEYSPNINIIVKKGYILNVLREEFQILKPELLILGTHGRSSFARAMLPSATENILQNPPCDVLIAS